MENIIIIGLIISISVSFVAHCIGYIKYREAVIRDYKSWKEVERLKKEVHMLESEVQYLSRTKQDGGKIKLISPFKK